VRGERLSSSRLHQGRTDEFNVMMMMMMMIIIA
jgi:hypothetical protein